MNSLHVFLTADTPLGRVDHSSFDDQTLMELLIADFPDECKDYYRDEDGYLDACDWEEVECDEAERVVQIVCLQASGSIALSSIPPKVKTFDMYKSNLCGTLETSELPGSISDFHIGTNNFHGTVDFTQLPESIVKFKIYRNNFEGSADLRRLPKSSRHFCLQKNKFSGSLFLADLPPNFRYIDVSKNCFTGDFVLENVPEPFSACGVKGNAFNEVAVVSKRMNKYIILEKCGIRRVLDEDGNRHRNEKLMLHTQNIAK